MCEPPAYLCTYLERRGLPFEIICIHEKQKVPDDLDDISGLIFMGGQGSVNDDKDWILAMQFHLEVTADSIQALTRIMQGVYHIHQIVCRGHKQLIEVPLT